MRSPAMKKQAVSNIQTMQIRWPIRRQLSNLGSSAERDRRRKLNSSRRHHHGKKKRRLRKNMSGSSRSQCCRNFRWASPSAGCICSPLWCSFYSCFYVQAQTRLKHSTCTDMHRRLSKTGTKVSSQTSSLQIRQLVVQQAIRPSSKTSGQVCKNHATASAMERRSFWRSNFLRVPKPTKVWNLKALCLRIMLRNLQRRFRLEGHVLQKKLRKSAWRQRLLVQCSSHPSSRKCSAEDAQTRISSTRSARRTQTPMFARKTLSSATTKLSSQATFALKATESVQAPNPSKTESA